MSNYIYVDVTRSVDGINIPWNRIRITQLHEYQYKEANNFNCFATIQRFASPDKLEEEQYLAPLWFDFDSDDDLQLSLEDTRRVAKFFHTHLEIDKQCIRIFYSGKKGFHIIIPPEVVNIEPSTVTHKVCKLIAQSLKSRLALNDKQMTTIDLTVYNNRRMLRLPNSIHQTTKLHKICLFYDELFDLTCDDIRRLAKKEKELTKYDITVSKKAASFVAFYVEQQKVLEKTRSLTSDNTEFLFTKDAYPVCVKNIIETGWKKDGDRNVATINLACFFKEAGYTVNEAINFLVDWVDKFTSATTKYEKQLRTQSTKNVCHLVYSTDEYNFGCAMIRSLHGEKDSVGNYDRVPCAGSLCSFLKVNTQENDATLIELTQTSDAAYYSKLIKTNVMVAGKKDTPYIVPYKLEYSCYGNCKKKNCPLYAADNHTLQKNIDVADKALLKMCAVPYGILNTLLKELSGIFNCTKFNVDVIETINVYELLVIPMIDTDEEASGHYTVRKIYSVGNLDITENKYYQLHGYVYPNPKNQESTLLVQNSYPLQDVVDSFEFTEEIKNQLNVFKVEDFDFETIAEKLEQILFDLTYNVTGIVERDEVLLGILLVYHSVLKFKVPWDNKPIRGWLETVVIGDTGTGKSHLIDKLQRHIGLGTRVNAESTSRTGLTYKMEQYNNSSWFIQWGAWPLADKELIWIDECSAIDKQEYGHMTLARSDGKLEVKRAVTAETSCRVRAIMSGNAAKGKRLTSYTHGVESLADIFNNEDIRRFDFALFLRATDVNPELYNKKFAAYPVTYTKEALKNNILFAWSRHINQVVISDDTVEEIYAVTTEISKDYGNASLVPIVSSADQRNKIARLAVALAALVHSVRDDSIVVKPCHVQFIGSYLHGIYTSQACGLNYYNKLTIKEETITEDKFENIKAYIIKHNPHFKFDEEFNSLVTMFAKQKTMTVSDIEAMLNISKEATKTLAQTLTKAGLLIRTSFGFKKTARFNYFINKFCELGFLEDEEDIFSEE